MMKIIDNDNIKYENALLRKNKILSLTKYIHL